MKKFFGSKGTVTKKVIRHRDTNLISKKTRETIKDIKTPQALNDGSLRKYGHIFEERQPKLCN